MAYDLKKKKLAFKILASIFLIATVGFLFVPSIMITTTTTTTLGSSTSSDRYSAATIILGTFASETEENAQRISESGYEGEKIAYYMKTEGEKLKISDKDTTILLSLVILMSVVFAIIAGILNLISLFKIKQKIQHEINIAISFFIIASTICAIVAFTMSYFWVSGSYSAGTGESLIRTNVKSYGYLGLLLNMISTILAFVFFQDRKIKE